MNQSIFILKHNDIAEILLQLALNTNQSIIYKATVLTKYFI